MLEIEAFLCFLSYYLNSFRFTVVGRTKKSNVKIQLELLDAELKHFLD